MFFRCFLSAFWVVLGTACSVYAQLPPTLAEVLRVEASAVLTKVRMTQGSYRFKDDFGKMRSWEGGIIPDSVGIYREERVDSHCMRLRIQIYDARHVRVVFRSHRQEQIFGLGEQFSYMSLKGHRVPIWVEEQGIGRGDQPITAIAQLKHAGGNQYTTFAPIPQFITTDRRSFQLWNNERSIFDFRDDAIAVEVFADSMNLLICSDSNPQQLVARWTEMPAGSSLPSIPDWALGAMVGLQGGTQIMLEKLNKLTEAGSLISGVWIQDWCGSRKTRYGQQLRWYWEADSTRYPDIKQVSARLAADSIALLGYINPFLIGEGHLFEEAVVNRFLLTDSTHKPIQLPVSGFDAYIIDLYNPQARRWVARIIQKNMLENGFAGWMADFGEWAPTDHHQPHYAHNMNPYYWALTNRMAIDSFGNAAYHAFFSRSAYRGATTLPNFYWAGDQMPTWGKNDGLPSAVCAIVSGGWSGILTNHSDIGGFTAVKKGIFRITRSRQLLKRWIELGTFSPIMRTHESIQPSILQVYTDPDMLKFFAHFTYIRKLLFPYLRQCADQATTQHQPMARHLWYSYPDDPNTPFIHHEYMLGTHLLVAPVVHKNQKTMRVYIPQGTWEHIFTGKTYTQGWHTLPSPVGTPPVFIDTQSPFYKSDNYAKLRILLQNP